MFVVKNGIYLRCLVPVAPDSSSYRVWFFTIRVCQEGPVALHIFCLVFCVKNGTFLVSKNSFSVIWRGFVRRFGAAFKLNVLTAQRKKGYGKEASQDPSGDRITSRTTASISIR